MGYNSVVLVSCVWVGGILAAHGGGNCWTLLPLSSGSLGKKGLRVRRKLRRSLIWRSRDGCKDALGGRMQQRPNWSHCLTPLVGPAGWWALCNLLEISYVLCELGTLGGVGGSKANHIIQGKDKTIWKKIKNMWSKDSEKGSQAEYNGQIANFTTNPRSCSCFLAYGKFVDCIPVEILAIFVWQVYCIKGWIFEWILLLMASMMCGSSSDSSCLLTSGLMNPHPLFPLKKSSFQFPFPCKLSLFVSFVPVTFQSLNSTDFIKCSHAPILSQPCLSATDGEVWSSTRREGQRRQTF